MNATIPCPPRDAASGRRMLLLVAALLALPFAIGGGLYFAGWQPARTVNQGNLISPALPLPAHGLTTPGDKALATAELGGRWLLVLNVSGACDASCRERIDEMRRIQVSLYKDMGRLRRAVLTDTPGDPTLAAAGASQPDLVVAHAPPGWLPGSTSDGAPSLYIVDPQGNLIMHYRPETGARAVRADLERLLKFAWNG
jgi:hypothetical protein